MNVSDLFGHYLHNLQLTYEGADQHSLFADPLFLDADNGNYRLGSGSPAAKLGIVDLQWAAMGPDDSYGFVTQSDIDWNLA